MYVIRRSELAFSDLLHRSIIAIPLRPPDTIALCFASDREVRYWVNASDACQETLRLAMSAIGTKRTSLFAPHMSALGGKADIPIRDPLLAHSGHRWLHRTCPLSGVKRTSQNSVTSGNVTGCNLR